MIPAETGPRNTFEGKCAKRHSISAASCLLVPARSVADKARGRGQPMMYASHGTVEATVDTLSMKHVGGVEVTLPFNN